MSEKRTPTPYYALFTMRDLFQNPNMASVLPQIGNTLQNVYSFKATEERVRNYIKGIFKAQDGEDGLLIRGKHISVLNRLKGLTGQIEALFNAMPTVVKNIRANTKLRLPYATLSQIKGLNSYAKRTALIKQVLANLNYNPDFNNKINAMQSFNKQQKAWEKRTGYKG